MAGGTQPPKSDATKALEKVSAGLKTAHVSVGKARPPIAQLVTIVERLDKDLLLQGILLCREVDDLCSALDNIHFGLRMLSNVPGLKPILGTLVSVLDKLKLKDKIQKTTRDLKTKLENLQKQIKAKIEKAATGMLKEIERFSELIRSWNDALSTMKALFHLADLAVFVLFEKNTTNTTASGTVTSLKATAAGITTQIAELQNSFQPILTFAQGDVLQFNQAALGALKLGLGDVATQVRNVRTYLSPVGNFINGVRSKLGRVANALDAVGKFFDWVISPLVNAALRFIRPLQNLLDSFRAVIERGLPINTIQERLKILVGDEFDKLTRRLDGLVTTELATFTEVARRLDKNMGVAREGPGKALVSLLVEGAKTKPANTATVNPSPALKTTSEPAPLFQQVSALEIDEQNSFIDPDGDPLDDAEGNFWGAVSSNDVHIVEDLQLRLDQFIDATDDTLEPPMPQDDFFTTVLYPVSGSPIAPNINNNPKTPARRQLEQTTTAQVAVSTAVATMAPKLEFADYGEEPVACLIRIDQKRVLDQQKGLLVTTLAPLKIPSPSTALVAEPETTIADNSSGRSAVFASYAAKVAALSVDIRKANGSIARLSASAWQADKDFSSLAPEAKVFGDQVVAMLRSLDGLLGKSSDALSLPLRYLPKQAELVNVLTQVGVPVSIRSLVPKATGLIQRANTTVVAARKDLKTVTTTAATTSASFKSLHDKAFALWSPDRFSKALAGRPDNGAGGQQPTATNFSTLVSAVQAGLFEAEQRFYSVIDTGDLLYKNSKDLKLDATKEAEIRARLDKACAALQPFVEAATAEAKLIPLRVDALYEVLAKAHASLKTFSAVTRDVSQLCRAVETQIIAADMLRSLGERVSRDMAPFTALLDGLPSTAATKPARQQAQVGGGGITTAQQPRQQPPASGKPLSPAQAAVKMAISAAGRKLDVTWQRITAFVGGYVIKGFEDVLSSRYLNVKEVQTKLSELDKAVKGALTNNNVTTLLDSKIQDLTRVVASSTSPFVDANALKVIADIQMVVDAVVPKAA